MQKSSQTVSFEVYGRAGTHDPDDFRTKSLYNEAVEKALIPHVPYLREVYKHFTTVTAIKKRMSVRDWVKFLAEVHFFDEDFTRCEGKLAFVWAQMKTADVVKHYAEFSTLSFTDFLEALCRVAVAKTWPADGVLDPDQFTVEGALDYFDKCESYNDDPKKAPFMEEPAEYYHWTEHRVASRVTKLLLTIYRRIQNTSASNTQLSSKCARPGEKKALEQLGLDDDSHRSAGGPGFTMVPNRRTMVLERRVTGAVSPPRSRPVSRGAAVSRPVSAASPAFDPSRALS